MGEVPLAGELQRGQPGALGNRAQAFELGAGLLDPPFRAELAVVALGQLGVRGDVVPEKAAVVHHPRNHRDAGALGGVQAVDEINGLNVYPVPDGDTGSNMFATVKAALDEAEAVSGGPAERIAAAISFGALMGARGNSGVITSQIFRGMADGLGGKKRFNGLDLAHALSEGAPTATSGAVAKPVEGTILTVIRESAAAAVEAAERDNDIETVLGATLAGAERSVARTPTLLAILREAGVVDAGGQGLYRLFQGALLHLLGQAPVTTGRRRAAAGPKPSTLVAHSDEGFGYETMFLLQAVGHQPLDPRRDP